MPIEDFSYERTPLSPKPWTAGKLFDLYQAKKLVFNTEYQRSAVWKRPRKQLLVDSILRQYDISTIFLRQCEDGTFECLDGQQRLRAIFDFMKDGYPLSPDITPEIEQEIIYSKLPDGLRSRIREFIVNSNLVSNIDEETTSDIFLRLQEGMPLNSAEKLNAMQGRMRRRVIELSRHPFFANIGVADNRFAHRYLAAQMISLAVAKTLIDTKFRSIKKNYLDYKSRDLPSALVERIKSNLTLLENSLRTKASAIRSRADIITLFTVANTLRGEYSITDIEKNFGKFILSFLMKIEEYDSLPTNNKNREIFAKYEDARRSSIDTSKNIRTRHDIMLSKFLETNPSVIPKDPNRLFSEAERLALYLRADGRCEKCKKATKFEDGDADHKKRHADGGKTILSNGRWLCASCNRSRGKKR